MSDTLEVRVPDIGDFKDVQVIEVMVKPGDRIAKDASLITLESDKASMEVPSTAAGIVQDVRVKVGDKVAKGSVIVTLAASETAAPAANTAPAPAKRETTVDVVVPDIGDFKDVQIIEVLVKPGDTIAKDASVVTLESDKASMEVPASAGGTIVEVRAKVGDRVSKGSVLATMRTSESATVQAPPAAAAPAVAPAPVSALPAKAPPVAPIKTNGIVHASPAIRRFARELGVDLQGLSGSGPHGRVTREDVQSFVKRALQGDGASAGGGIGVAGLPPWPVVDFAQYGEIERKPLSRIKKVSGPNLHRNWLQIPHITNYDEADITDLEAFRLALSAEQTKKGGPKVTMLAFLMKACVATLQQFPDFNASLDGDSLVYKKYYNIGFAADTPNGLVVPVIKNADRKGLIEIAHESAELAGKAREGKLGLSEMQGGTFTISSIGGIGGTQFTQIVNAPEVAILGATRAAMRPVWNGKKFKARLMLPISVSYDHRVIDGAAAARFLVYLSNLLADFRRVLL